MLGPASADRLEAERSQLDEPLVTHQASGDSGHEQDLPLAAIATPRIDLVVMPPPLLAALLSGDREEAGWVAGFALAEELFSTDPAWVSFLEMRLDQVRRDPAWAPWSLRAIVLRSSGLAAGYANFHGPPGVNDTSKAGAAEIGYEVWARYRNQGFATEVARAMMEWASRVWGVTRFISGVAPDNLPSLRVNRKLGFRATGQVVDGELIFELIYAGSQPT